MHMIDSSNKTRSATAAQSSCDQRYGIWIVDDLKMCEFNLNLRNFSC